MKKIAFSACLIILLVTLAYVRRPDLATHQERILAHTAMIAGRDAVTIPPAQLPALVFHDLYLVTTTSDPQTGALVSFGFGRYIKILNDAWGERALAALPASTPR